MVRSNEQTGFSLLEILIVLAIIGIISAVAVPSYQASTLRAARAEGKSVLLQVAANQERFYSSNNTYSTDANPLVNPALATLTSESGAYEVAVAACGAGTIANCFLATATAQGRQAVDACTSMTLSNTGVKGSTGASVNECWQN